MKLLLLLFEILVIPGLSIGFIQQHNFNRIFSQNCNVKNNFVKFQLTLYSSSDTNNFNSNETKGFNKASRIIKQDKTINKVQTVKSQLENKGKDTEVWKSGYLLKKNDDNRRRNNDPWWMREEEKTNPLFLPKYQPWWIKSNVMVNNSWKVLELRQEAKRRGLPTSGNKVELVEMLIESSKKYDLSDQNFHSSEFIPMSKLKTNSCYPDVYEGENIEILQQKARLVGPPTY
eukprot:gene5621-7763_t